MKRKNKKFQKKNSNSLNKLSLFQKMMAGIQKNVRYLLRTLQLSITKIFPY